MAHLFISHASPDRAFAIRLASTLQQLGHLVWIDMHDIGVGESIPHRLAEAIERADYLIVVLSKYSAASSWIEREWHAKYWDEVKQRCSLVLPVVLEDCHIPLFLRPKRYADFRSEYAVGLAQLAIVLHAGTHTTTQSAIECQAWSLQTRVQPVDSQSLVSCKTSLWYDADTMSKRARLVEVQVALEVPYVGKIAGVWKPDEREHDAAWELYVELGTRIAVAQLAPGDGLLRESLSSLYGIFTTTRQILRTYGPVVARPKEQSELSFGYLAMTMLNCVLRPVLAKWHPLLLDYEHSRASAVSPLEHEASWVKAEELRTTLNEVRAVLIAYTNLLAQISQVPTGIRTMG